MTEIAAIFGHQPAVEQQPPKRAVREAKPPATSVYTQPAPHLYDSVGDCLIWDADGQVYEDLLPVTASLSQTNKAGTWEDKRAKIARLHSMAEHFELQGCNVQKRVVPINIFHEAAGDLSEEDYKLRLERETKMVGKSIRQLSTIRKLLNNKNFVVDAYSPTRDKGMASEMNPKAERPSKRPLKDRWPWQRQNFRKDNMDYTGVEKKSAAQLRAEAKQREDRHRIAELRRHLRNVAKYKPLNRAPLRTCYTEQERLDVVRQQQILKQLNQARDLPLPKDVLKQGQALLAVYGPSADVRRPPRVQKGAERATGETLSHDAKRKKADVMNIKVDRALRDVDVQGSGGTGCQRGGNGGSVRDGSSTARPVQRVPQPPSSQRRPSTANAANDKLSSSPPPPRPPRERCMSARVKRKIMDLATAFEGKYSARAGTAKS